MSDAVPFQRNQRIRLRPRGHDQEVAAEVIDARASALWTQLLDAAPWLEDHHLEGGVELAFWQHGSRHLAPHARVLAFDLDRGRIHLERPTRTQIVQRRQTFRESVQISARLLPADQPPETRDLVGREVTTQDIGGGGVCLQIPGQTGYAIDDELLIELSLPQSSVRARGKVRWSKQDEDGLTKLGVAFTRISQREKDLVYGFLFDVQRHRLRAG
ncbi:MAG: PilZ domain-containing protein [Myxococcota bacterium]